MTNFLSVFRLLFLNESPIFLSFKFGGHDGTKIDTACAIDEELWKDRD